MKSLFGLLLTAIVVLLGGIYAWNQMRRVPLVLPAQPQAAENPICAEAQEAEKAVAFTGPLADYMSRQKASPEAKEAKQVETLQRCSL